MSDGAGLDLRVPVPEERAAKAKRERKHDADWWANRIAVIGWAVLTISWLVLGVWLLRLGEATSVVWSITGPLVLGLLVAWPVAVAGLVVRRGGLALAAIATIVVQLVIAWPLLPLGGHDRAGSRPISIGSWNTFADNDQLDAAARELAADRLPDILVFQEYTPAARDAMRRAGIEARYAHRIDDSEPLTGGFGIYSRFPVRAAPAKAPGDDVVWSVVTLPSGKELRIANVHVFPPQPGDAASWQQGLEALGRSLDATSGRWIAIGDYNATASHRLYRDLLGHGRRDAHTATGRGYARSWPADQPIPAVLLIDHAIVSPEVRVAATSEQTLPGSDHRMIRVSFTT